jgi:hypothetical protein
MTARSAAARRQDRVTGDDPLHQDFSPEGVAPRTGLRCGACGEIILSRAAAQQNALVELQCNRCGTTDIYHANWIRPLPGALLRGKRG